MPQPRSALKAVPEAKRRKRKNPLIAHRKCSEFKEFVKLLRESHARVSSNKQEDEKVETVHS